MNIFAKAIVSLIESLSVQWLISALMFADMIQIIKSKIHSTDRQQPAQKINSELPSLPYNAFKTNEKHAIQNTTMEAIAVFGMSLLYASQSIRLLSIKLINMIIPTTLTICINVKHPPRRIVLSSLPIFAFLSLPVHLIAFSQNQRTYHHYQMYSNAIKRYTS